MSRFKAKAESKEKKRTQHRTGRFKTGLTLPPQITAELIALGHPPPASSSSSRVSSRKPHRTPNRQTKDKAAPPIHTKTTEVKPKSKSIIKPDPPTQPTTALGKLVARQDAKPSVTPKSKKRKQRSSEEDIEDKRIAWLERELGLGNSSSNGKGKLRQEFEEDGLEDLFDGLEALDKLVENLQQPLSDHEPKVAREKDLSDDESEWSGCHDEIVTDDDDETQPILDTTQSSSTLQPSGEEILDPKIEAHKELSENLQNSASTSVPTRYIPPHLRQIEVSSNNSTTILKPQLDPRLRRQLMGILNRVSPTTIPTCLESLSGLYRSHPRATVTEGLIEVILELIGSHDELGASLAVTYSALIAAICRGGIEVSGVEIGWAPNFISSLSLRLCTIYQKSDSNPFNTGKTGINLLGFISHLYFFQVIGCPLVYDFVRLLINEGLNEARVEGLMVLLKNAGPRLRHDDPVALKEIVQMAQANKGEGAEASSRTKFMFETLLDLKNNKIRKEAQAASSAVENLKETLKKYLSGVAKKSSTSSEPLQLTLKDLKEAEKRGKWWLIGAAWDGDPLLELESKSTTAADTNEALVRLAKQQGMNTDVRRSVFTTLMTAEDYVDASEKLDRLGLTAIQQREIVRVLLHCLGNEATYNPYYTLVGQKLASDSHSFQITLQFALWDFFRELGETEVGGREMLKGLTQSTQRASSPDKEDESMSKRVAHLTLAYGWWIAKGSLPISVLKSLPFGQLRSQTTYDFLTKLLSRIILSIHSTSPSLAPSTISYRIDRTGLENVFGKARRTEMGDGLAEFLDGVEGKLLCDSGGTERHKDLMRTAQKTVIDVLSSGGLV